MDEVVQEGNHVVLMKSFDSGNMKIVSASRNTIVHYGKLHFDPSPLIGAKFGAVFEIGQDGSMTEVEDFEAFDDELSTTVSSKLSTFEDKSQFSREKIIKKKKKQNHANIVTVIRPNLMLINEMLYARDKLGGLRSDALAQMITSANLQNGIECLVLDHNLGILTSAVMSRILPNGKCIQLIQDNESICTTRKTLSMLNITEEVCGVNLCAITMRDVYKISTGTDNFNYENDILRARGEDHLERLKQISTHTMRDPETGEKSQVEMAESERKDLNQTLMKRDTNRELRNRERCEAAKLLKKRSLDSIIIVVQNDLPLPIIKLLYPFLAPSRQFVIYSDTIEPLLECHQYLKTNSLAVSLNLSESWLRRYQVLPDRTRPEMNISGYGGYLLSGTKALFGSPQSENNGKTDLVASIEVNQPIDGM